MISSYQVDGIEDFMLEFHEANQSTVLTSESKLGTSIYLKFKNGFEGVMSKNVKQTSKLLMNTKENPCDEKNEQRREIQISRKTGLLMGCNLQWSRFKIAGFKDCATQKEMQDYYKIARNIGKEMDDLLPNCKEMEWHTFEYFMDLNHVASNISKIGVGLVAFDNTVSFDLSVYLNTNCSYSNPHLF